MEMAFRYSHFLEDIAQKTVFAKLLGKVNTIKPEEVLAEELMEGTRP